LEIFWSDDQWRICLVWQEDDAYQVESWITTTDLTMAELLDEIHPGEILLRHFMKPMGISARQLTGDIDVSPSRISNLVNGNRPITADMAVRLGLFFSMAPRFWRNLQTEYDMRVAARTLTERIAPRIRVFQASVVS